MGLYPMNCVSCHTPFMWWSGNMDQRCKDCQNKNPRLTGEQVETWMDAVDKKVNQEPLACGHKPCTLGYCKGCEQHCPAKKKAQ